MIGLCDCNNFFVSCERLFNPSLEGRPVIVLSNNDGCVVARSNESKALGIKMATPLYQIQELVKRENVAVYSSNYQLYGDISDRIMQTLRGVTPSIEVYSIDEAFLDLRGIPTKEVAAFGRHISQLVRRNIGIPVSVGIAPTKTLAKIASELCKSYPKLNGSCAMYRGEDIKTVLTKYSIADIWGIGRKSAEQLKRYNITTAEHFRNAPEQWVERQLGVSGVKVWRELHGQIAIPFERQNGGRQTISVSRSYSNEIYDIEQLIESISTFTTIACEKLRAQGSVTKQLEVYLATNRHRVELPQCNLSKRFVFDVATDSTLEVLSTAIKMLREIFKPGFGYKKGGVILSHLSANNSVQGSIFDSAEKREKHHSLMEIVDRVNNEFGRSSITFGASNKEISLTNRDHLSPCYTTVWDDIIKVKV